MLNLHALTEMTDGRHKGKIHREELMTDAAAADRNRGMVVIQWLKRESADQTSTASTGMTVDERAWIG